MYYKGKIIVVAVIMFVLGIFVGNATKTQKDEWKYFEDANHRPSRSNYITGEIQQSYEGRWQAPRSLLGK